MVKKILLGRHAAQTEGRCSSYLLLVLIHALRPPESHGACGRPGLSATASATVNEPLAYQKPERYPCLSLPTCRLSRACASTKQPTLQVTCVRAAGPL
jgi:hypothetical protein